MASETPAKLTFNKHRSSMPRMRFASDSTFYTVTDFKQTLQFLKWNKIEYLNEAWIV